jgi:hypothetical protein
VAPLNSWMPTSDILLTTADACSFNL